MAWIKYKQRIILTGEIEGSNQDKDNKQMGERIVKEMMYVFLPEPTQLPNTGTHKEGKEGNLLVPFLYTTYSWINNSFIWENREKCTGIIIIRIVPIWQPIICCTQDTIKIHYYWFVRHTNIIIYNNQQQQKVLIVLIYAYSYTYNNQQSNPLLINVLLLWMIL